MGFQSNPSSLLVLPLFLFISITFFSFSLGNSGSQRLEKSPVAGFTDERELNGVVEWNTGGSPVSLVTSELPLKCGEGGPNQPNIKRMTRRLAAAVDSGNSTYLILAADRTHRKDPTDHFNYYTGGWNITNSHYISSVGYSAAPPVIVAVIWFLLFGLWLFCICCCCCCFPRKEHHSYSRTIFALSLCSLLLLTAAAAAGTAVLYTGQAKFQNSIVSVSSYVLKQADTVIVNLRNLLNNLMAAKKVGVGDQPSLPKEYQDEIDQMRTTINTLADNFRNITGKSSTDIKNFLDSVSTCLMYVAAAMIVLAILGLLFSVLGLQCLLYILMIIGWVLVAATFIMTGVFLLIHNVVTDTCIAMDDWLQNPNANSALEELLPKVDNETAQRISVTTKDATFGIISAVNGVISNVSNAKIPPEAGPLLYYNQSGPLMPLLCNPYESNHADRQCATDEVDFKVASVVWKKYVCEVKSGICITPGRLTPERYTQIMASVNVSYGLYKESPFLVDLIDSTFVKETFGSISEKHCPDLSKYSEMTYVGFIVSSCAVMVSIILWIVYARQRKRRADSKKSLNMMTMPMHGRSI